MLINCTGKQLIAEAFIINSFPDQTLSY